jgi:hypothetical protein
MPRQSSTMGRKIDTHLNRDTKKSSVQIFKNTGDGEERSQMISEAAYYRAMLRGFNGGDPIYDWLMAEVDIDGMLFDW